MILMPPTATCVESVSDTFRRQGSAGAESETKDPQASRGEVVVGEEPLDCVLQRAVVVDEALGDLARFLQEVAVGAELRETEVRQARLTGPEQLTFAP